MIPEQHYKALETIIDRLKGQRIEWAVIGSANLALQGVDVEVHDIDILTDKSGICHMIKLLKEYLVQPLQYKEKSYAKGYHSLLNIQGVDIELIGETEHRLFPGGEWSHKSRLEDRKLITYQGLPIPLTTLKTEYQFYDLMGRKDKVDKIIEALERKARKI